MNNYLSKSPKRKLSFIRIPSKKNPEKFELTVIEKNVFDHYHRIRGWSLKDFNHHFSIGHRIYRQTRNHWYTKEEQKVIQGNKISKSQKEKNSNKVNFYKPRNLIELERLKEVINNSNSQVECLNKLGITKYIFTSNLQYHDLHFDNSEKIRRKHDMFDDKDMSVMELLALNEPKVFSNIMDGIENGDSIKKALDYLTNLSYDIRVLRSKLSRSHRKTTRRCKPLGSIIEYRVKKILDSLEIDYIPQLHIEKYWYDFLLLGFNIILEIDGSGHDTTNDIKKDNLAKIKGFKIIHVKVPKKVSEERLTKLINDVHINLNK